MLKLFYSSGSCALASLIALHDADADFEVAHVELAKGAQHAPEFLAINPKGRVPALATDRGILTETPAILAYIAQSFPSAKLAPLDEAYEFARLQAFNAYICSTVHVNHAHGRRGGRWADEASSQEDMKRKVPETMAASMALIERDLFEGPWVMGEQYTIADPYLYTIERWLKGDGVDITDYPQLHDHHQRMAERDSVRRALSEASLA